MPSKRGDSECLVCFGCQCIIDSPTFQAPFEDTDHALCFGCTEKCRDDDLVPGGDFGAGELWFEFGQVVVDGE